MRERADRPDLIEGANDISYANEAIEFLNEHNIHWDIDSPNDWQDYEYHFILALHATLWGAKKYHAAKKATS